jgi:CheY-like chemotaxis protein
MVMERTKIGITPRAAQSYGELYGRQVLLGLTDNESSGDPASATEHMRLEAELRAMRQLNTLVAQLLTCPNTHPALQQILAGSLRIARASHGTVHVWDESTQTLALAAHRGFDASTLKELITERQAESAQMQAAITRQRVVAEDISIEMGTADSAAATVQATPLLGCRGAIIGVLSTYYADSRHPSDSELRLLDFYARQAATLIDPSTALEPLTSAASDVVGSTPTESPNDEKPAPREHGLGLRVLVVDDNKPAADMLALVLESFGNELRTAYDGQQATEVADAFRPDVILLDIGMPIMDGYETARCIREQSRGREPVLIALSGRGETSDKERTREAGFYQHVVKPAKAADLCKLLARVSARRN